MKKILFLIAIPMILFAQNTDKTSPMQSQQQLIWNAFEKTAEVFRVKIVSGSIGVTVAGIDSLEVNSEEANKLLQDIENRQAILQDSLGVLNTTQRVIKGYLNLGNIKTDTSNARLSVANSILQDVEDRISVLQDSLHTLNTTQLIIKGYLTLTNTKLDSLKNDTELLRSLISTLNGMVATSARQDSSKNDTELIRGLLVELRTALQIIDDWDDGANKANVNATQTGTWTVGTSQHTTSLDTIITISATTATQLPAITGCKEIMITNLTSGATLRIGKDNSVATQGGIYWYGDSMYTVKDANVSKFYAYSNIETSVRISWGF